MAKSPSSEAKNKATLQKVANNRAKQAYQFFTVFSTVEGQDVLRQLNEQFYDISTYRTGDSYATHINEGGRMVMLHINNLIQEHKDGD